jgi:hypothetical protein
MRLKWKARGSDEAVVDAPRRVEAAAHPARGVARVPAGEHVAICRRPPLTPGQAHRAPGLGRRQ